MADAVVEPAPATHAQDDSKENTNAKAGENKNGSVKDDVETKPDIEEFAEAEKRNLNSNGNSRSRHDGHKSKFANRKHEDFRKNVKTNYDTLPESSDPDEIRKQVEFYFSDSNLAYDDYMSSLVGGSDNHAVPIKIIHSFKRMRRFQPFSAVIAALQDSKVLDLINDAEIRRKVPFEPPKAEDDEFDDPSIPRAIYAKGFGEEGSSTQFDIETFFAPYGPINGVRLRRNLPSRKFKGSVFVEFETEDLQQEFLALEEKPKWSGQDLIYMSKREYCETKVKDIKAGKIQPNKKHQYKQYLPRSQHSNRDRDRDNNNNGNKRRGDRDRDRNRRNDRDGKDGRRNRDDWKGRRDDFQSNRFRSPSPESEADKDNNDDGTKKEEDTKPEVAVAPDVQDGVEESKKRGREEDDGGDDVQEPQQETKKIKNDDGK